MMRNPSFLLVCVAIALAGLGGCEGKDGLAFGVFLSDGSVTSMNLTSLGVPVSSGLADPTESYELTPGLHTVQWTVGGVNVYVANLEVLINEGEDGKLLDPGSDGEDTTVIVFFSDSNLYTSGTKTTYTGSPF